MRILRLELVPEVLIVDFVVVLHLGYLNNRSKESRATVGGSLFEIREPVFHVFREQLVDPLGFPDVLERIVDVVRQIPLGGADVFSTIRAVPFDAGAED